MSHIRWSSIAFVLGAAASAFGRDETQVWSNSFGNAQLGVSIAVVGDLTGDGIADFVAGAHDALVPYRAGRVFVVNGASGATIRTLYGVDAAYSFGTRVAAAGDVNGDLVPDFLTTAPRPFFFSQPGRARVHSGTDGAVLREFSSTDLNFANDLAGGHDLDGDTVPDIVIATTQSFSGFHPPRVEAFSGATGVRIYELASPIPNAFDYELEFIGDLDGDNVSDLALGSYDADTTGTNSGHVHVFSAATGAALFDIPGLDSFDWFGYSLTALGDVNADGKPDFAVGAANDELGAPSAGSVSVISGATGIRLWTTAGSFASQRLGYSVTRIADLNSNGVAEVVCGSFDFPSQFHGSIVVRDGQTGNSLYTLAGTTTAPLATVLAGIPDTDGDGTDEILNGVPWFTGSYTGRLSRITPAPSAPAIALDIEGSITHYGGVIADSAGNVPHLEASGVTAPGGSLTIAVQNAIGGQLCAMLIGTTEIGEAISINGALLLTSPITYFIAPLSGTGPGNGTLSFSATIPATALPPSVHMQALCGDPGSPLGFTPTRAAKLKF